MKHILVTIHSSKIQTVLENILLQFSDQCIIYYAVNYSEACEILLLRSMDVFFIEDYILHTHSSSIMGLQLIKKIRNIHQYQFSPIFFFSKMEKSILYAYNQFHCYSCLEYPFDSVKLSHDIKAVINYDFYHTCVSDIYFKQDGILYHIPVKTITCIKCQREHLLLYRFGKKVEVYSYHSCRQILELLDSPDFIQCSKSTIINRSYIESINEANQTLQLASVKVPITIGSSYKTALLKSLDILANYHVNKAK